MVLTSSDIKSTILALSLKNKNFYLNKNIVASLVQQSDFKKHLQKQEINFKDRDNTYYIHSPQNKGYEKHNEIFITWGHSYFMFENGRKS
ncbi:hypothetical protein PJIAN_3128 [Paludibacter jiangxiensis]|uniref:Uncharacterized protein n=1 Tax=Paludibacter jiangxiensis TaxID=681398 RepID=A0A170ZM96_9BACT|nr:hypothetical protein PJIAN_3128 [Paludibacter jiangxiensis]